MSMDHLYLETPFGFRDVSLQARRRVFEPAGWGHSRIRRRLDDSPAGLLQRDHSLRHQRTCQPGIQPVLTPISLSRPHVRYLRFPPSRERRV